MHPPPRIAVFRALQLGDMLCAVPALRALRGLYQHAHITLIGLPWARAFQRRYQRYLDDFIDFPGYPGLPERSPDLAAIPSFLLEVQRRSLDLAIQLHGSGQVTNPLIAMFGARHTTGFFLPGHWCPEPASFCPYPDREHEIRRNLRL